MNEKSRKDDLDPSPPVPRPSPLPEELRLWDRRVVWHAFTQMAEYEPLVIERAEGCTLIDIDGNRYLDATSSLWCNIHGHRHPKLDEAIRRQLDRVAHVTNLGASNPATIQLAKRLVDLAPPGLEHVFFSDDGATAVEVALKMAFQYWRQCPEPQPEKTWYVAFADAYHGDTLGSVSVGGVERFHAMFKPLLFKTLRAAAPNPYRTPPGVTRATASEYYLGQLEKVLAADHPRIAALVIEPLVQAAAGMIVHPPGFLRGVRELTRRYGVLLIADEVAVGMGRTGKMFACGHEGVTPDFLCLAKGLTGGVFTPGGDAHHRRNLAGVSGDIRPGPHLLPRPHLRRQSARLSGRPGHARCLRGRTNAAPSPTQDRPAGRAPGPHRRHAARGRRASVRPDRGHRAGPRPIDQRAVPLAREAWLASLRIRPAGRSLAPSAGRRDCHHAAAGDHAR